MKKNSILVLNLLVAASASAEIRTFQPKSNVMNENHQVQEIPNQSTQDSKFRENIDKLWKKMAATYGGASTDPQITFYIHTDDYTKDMNNNMRRLISMTEVLTPSPQIQYYMNDNGYGRESPYFLAGLQDLGESYEFNVDRDNDVAVAFNLERKSMIIYRSPDGAIRLYSLAYEVDKLERQLKRQAEGAKVAP
ncbi:MAG: hypothetical protein WAZ18_04125 [Alphaproteobacteria bacterium]